MEDDKVLADMIRDYPDALLDRKKLQALLLDFFPKDRLKRNLLLLAFDDGVVSEMRGLKQADKMTLHRFVRSIELGYDVKTRSAETAVSLWAKAIGLQAGDEGENSGASGNGTKVYAGKEQISEEGSSAEKEWVPCESGSLYEYEETMKGIKIQKYMDFDEDVVVIPNVIAGKKVYAIENHAFKGCVGIEKIIVSEGIEILGNGVFLNCRELKEVVLPQTLRCIGTTDPTGCPKILGSLTKYDGTFENSGLEEIVIPDNVKSIGENAFAGCQNLKRAVLPDRLREIKENTFRWCKSLKDVVLAGELETIRISAFEGCEALKEIELPEGMTSIEEGAFAGCKSLESVYIPDSVIEIGGGKGNGFLKTFGEPGERHENLTIRCNAGSYAMQYARAQQIRCERA